MTTNVFDQPSPASIQAYYAGMRPFWHPVLPAADLPDDRPVGVELLGEPVVLARLDGQVVAMQDLCRHFQARLSIGEIQQVEGRECLMCLYHGWTYSADGQCVHIPQLAPGREIPGEAKLPVYLAQEQQDLIWVCLDAEPTFDISAFPELDDESFRAGPLRTYDPWHASAPRIVMGTLDDTHFPWVHEGILGERTHPEPPDHEVWRDGQYMMVRYHIVQPRNISTTADALGEEPPEEGQEEFITYTNYIGMPSTARLVKDVPGGNQYVIWATVAPNRFDTTTTFWRVARNYDLDPARDPVYEDFEDEIRGQDKPIVESQRPWLLPPFWTKIELPLRPADLPLIEYQKWLEELDIAIDV